MGTLESGNTVRINAPFHLPPLKIRGGGGSYDGDEGGLGGWSFNDW